MEVLVEIVELNEDTGFLSFGYVDSTRKIRYISCPAERFSESDLEQGRDGEFKVEVYKDYWLILDSRTRVAGYEIREGGGLPVWLICLDWAMAQKEIRDAEEEGS